MPASAALDKSMREERVEAAMQQLYQGPHVTILAQYAAATVVAQRAEPLPDHGGAGGRILFEELGDGRFTGSAFFVGNSDDLAHCYPLALVEAQ